MGRSAAGAVALVAAVVLVACGASRDTRADEQPTGPPDSLEAQVAEALEQDEWRTVSAKQRSILDEAIVQGEISFDQLNEAIQDTFQCFDGLGVTYGLDPVQEDEGFPVLGYHYAFPSGMTEEQAIAVTDACIVKNSGLVEMLYVSQPTSVEAFMDHWETTYKAAETACLEAHGVTVPEDVTYDEMAVLIHDLWRDEVTREPVGPLCFRGGEG